jgi:D-alanyl-D-alanine-carboxypeptidase/D-alanyl-D-alanine-endopeptidase
MALRLAAAALLLSQPTATAPLPSSNSPSVDGWEALRAAIDDFDLVPSVAVSVGDDRGELFRHTKGDTGFNTQMPIASATKWVSGVAIMRAVEEGFLSLNDLASTHLAYWTVDPEDARSRVTLRHLLSFTSGMSGSTSCPAELDFNQCVRDMYTRSSSQWEPG